MKRQFFIIFNILLIFIAFPTLGQVDSLVSIDSKIELANEKYKQGQFSDASLLYEEILELGISADIYYNLGNSYYKSGEIGLAILNYERALRLKPQMKDAIYNLQLAEKKVIDKVNTNPPFFVKKWINNVVSSLTSNQWTMLSLVFFLPLLTTFLFFLFSKTRDKKKFTFYTTAVLGVLFVITFVFAGIVKKQYINHDKAVILSGAVTVKSAPDQSGTDIFQLHEGTRVTIKNTLDNWVEIILENGAVGWIEENNIARI